MNVKKELFKHKTEKFRKFEANLVPNIDIKNIIGTKSTFQRQIAKNLYSSGGYLKFVNNVPHRYLEENLVHAHLIEYIKDFDDVLYATKKLLPYMDNWMVTDTISSRCFERNKKETLKLVNKCLNSKKTYTIRFGIILLKKYFLDEDFDINQMNKALSIKNKDYYVKMMQAWYIADGLIKHPKEFIKVLKIKKLDSFVQNKSIQKARESYRIPNSLKKELLKYKVSYEKVHI